MALEDSCRLPHLPDYPPKDVPRKSGDAAHRKAERRKSMNTKRQKCEKTQRRLKDSQESAVVNSTIKVEQRRPLLIVRFIREHTQIEKAAS